MGGKCYFFTYYRFFTAQGYLQLEVGEQPHHDLHRLSPVDKNNVLQQTLAMSTHIRGFLSFLWWGPTTPWTTIPLLLQSQIVCLPYYTVVTLLTWPPSPDWSSSPCLRRYPRNLRRGGLSFSPSAPPSPYISQTRTIVAYKGLYALFTSSFLGR